MGILVGAPSDPIYVMYAQFCTDGLYHRPFEVKEYTLKSVALSEMHFGYAVPTV
jgi:hypothetical protein